MPIFLLADGALDFSTIWTAFSTAFSTVSSFIAGNALLVTLIAVPLGAGFLAIIMKVFR